MIRRLQFILISFVFPMAATLALAADNSTAAERDWPYPAALVKKNLEHLKAYDGARLPTLEGFIPPQVQHLELYEQPYYQYRITLTSVDSKATRVHVEAKITAYYADTHTARSEYKTLPSNGRLESDLLDRLARALPSLSATRSDSTPTRLGQSSSTSSAADSVSFPPPLHAAVGIGSAPPAVTSSSAAIDQPAKPGVSPEQQLDAILAQRQSLREKSDKILSQIQGLQSGKSAVQHIELGTVRHSGVGVMSRTNYGGPVLFRAQADDEFEVLEVDGDWTKVSLGTGSSASNTNGWIETDELSIPPTVLQAKSKTPEEAPATAQAEKASVPPPSVITPSKPSDLGFWVSREEVSKFSGEWAHLKGKNVLYVYAQPRGVLSDLASDDTRLTYAKRVFESRVEKENLAGSYEGIVVVFMGSKGGVAAATLTDIRQWLQGSLAESTFVSRCSLDLPGQVAVSKAN